MLGVLAEKNAARHLGPAMPAQALEAPRLRALVDDRTGVAGPWPATLAGSPLYLAPELFDGAPASMRSEVYSLGVVLFRLLTARFPVEGGSLAEIEDAHRRRAVTDRSARADLA